MPRYAQIDETNLCISVSDLSGPVSGDHLIPIADDEFPLGKIRSGKKWIAGPKAPRALTFREFIALAYDHGGLTAAKYSEAKGNPLYAIFFDMLQAADGVEKTDPFTVSGAEAFVAGGIIDQAGADAIFANWPEA